MTQDEILNIEFSNEFDIYYNNITSNNAAGIDEYEKSVFLTAAQDDIVNSYFNARLNKIQQGFDDSPERQMDFSSIIKTVTKQQFEESRIDGRNNAKSLSLDEDALAILDEHLIVYRNGSEIRLQVIPLKYSEYVRLMEKYFKYPVKNHAWRLIDSSSNRSIELIAGPSDIIVKYVARYVKRPRAIRLVDLAPYSVSIDGGTSPQSCELDKGLHKDIIRRAAELAAAAYKADLGTLISLGNASQTELGIVSSKE